MRSSECRMTAALVKSGVFRDAPFSLIDVGASGGIAQRWFIFGDHLRAVGCDPLVAECERLNRESTNPNVCYRACFVVSNDPVDAIPDDLRVDPSLLKDNYPLARSSSTEAIRLLGMDYAREQYNRGAPMRHAEERITLDDFAALRPEFHANFLKVDTDGSDLQVLRGGRQLLRSSDMLGVAVEANLHGPIHPAANTWPHIDALLRENGFTLFDMSLWRFSRAALPAKFVYEVPAQTIQGQILWGDALYLRDLGAPDYDLIWGASPSALNVLKLACLFELHDLADCAAELLLQREALVSAITEVGPLLDLLTPCVDGAVVGYQRYVELFRDSPRRFFPSSPMRIDPNPRRQRRWQRLHDVASHLKQAGREVRRAIGELGPR